MNTSVALNNARAEEDTSFSTVNSGCEREASRKNSMLAGKQSGFKKEVRGLISVSR